MKGGNHSPLDYPERRSTKKKYKKYIEVHSLHKSFNIIRTNETFNEEEMYHTDTPSHNIFCYNPQESIYISWLNLTKSIIDCPKDFHACAANQVEVSKVSRVSVVLPQDEERLARAEKLIEYLLLPAKDIPSLDKSLFHFRVRFTYIYFYSYSPDIKWSNDPISGIPLPETFIELDESGKPNEKELKKTEEINESHLIFFLIPAEKLLSGSGNEASLVKSIYKEGKFGKFGSRHKFIVPLFHHLNLTSGGCDAVPLEERFASFCSVINKSGIFVGISVLSNLVHVGALLFNYIPLCLQRPWFSLDPFTNVQAALQYLLVMVYSVLDSERYFLSLARAFIFLHGGTLAYENVIEVIRNSLPIILTLVVELWQHLSQDIINLTQVGGAGYTKDTQPLVDTYFALTSIYFYIAKICVDVGNEYPALNLTHHNDLRGEIFLKSNENHTENPTCLSGGFFILARIG